MRIVLAKTAGFCMGVRRAVDMAVSLVARETGPVFTYGPLIHNPQVLKRLESQGLRVMSRVPEKGRGTVLIRAHGVAPQERDALVRAGFTVRDATCPRVASVQEILSRLSREGRPAVILGDPDHPEVLGLVGHAPERTWVIREPSEVAAIPVLPRLGVVSQTTQDQGLYGEIARAVEKRFPDARIFSTICGATEKRQKEAMDLARRVDAVVVVGGRESANTRRLYEVAQKAGTLSFHVEDPRELDVAFLTSLDTVGVTAGASTPRWIIREVCRSLSVPARPESAPVAAMPLEALG
ncbi:MAG: 4-hydroxy-3-methylbut-2-enyl diphosphate reductase [Proteobacteria bacterium]|nr:4-hydroxy-3-methylbut-2-enyl diphosphate reductase [Pseudomonadota bacterium]